jgi:tRNA (uracil-5-)-methyltransferase TRM9
MNPHSAQQAFPMDDQTADHLSALNHKFYEAFADPFSSTRQRLQPGVVSILEQIPPNASILDLGCGNGRLAKVLAERGFQGRYTGLDFSPQLLETARQNAPPGSSFQFIQADLSSAEWGNELPQDGFAIVLAFAVLHHLPGGAIRGRVLSCIHALLVTDGYFFHSNWQFLNSDRLRRRIQPWERAGIRPDDVDDGDFLLDWRQGGTGLRYVHHFSQPELERLAAETGFSVLETFFFGW